MSEPNFPIWLEAERDEVCSWCAYPFDTGDRLLYDDSTGRVFCGPDCRQHFRAGQQRRRAKQKRQGALAAAARRQCLARACAEDAARDDSGSIL